MTNTDTDHDYDITGTTAELSDIRTGLERLCDARDVTGYAAEEYIEEAIPLIDAAIQDIQAGWDETEGEREGGPK